MDRDLFHQCLFSWPRSVSDLVQRRDLCYFMTPNKEVDINRSDGRAILTEEFGKLCIDSSNVRKNNEAD
jgi:hypothetical protein